MITKKNYWLDCGLGLFLKFASIQKYDKSQNRAFPSL